MTEEKTAKMGSTQRKNEKRNDNIENNETPTRNIIKWADSAKYEDISNK